jgi:voltage-gated potassium channel
MAPDAPLTVVPQVEREGEVRRRRRRRFRLLFFPAVLLAIGTAGYMAIEEWSAFDSLYMTVITVTTVGYLEVHELTAAGRWFTMFLALGGVFTLFYFASALIGAIVSGQVRGDLRRQRMERTLAEMQGHVIVCGLGRMGRQVCGEFSAMRRPFVVIDRDPAVFEGFAPPHGVPMLGDATSDEALRRAGIERADVLVTLAASDADNLFITMSARLLNEKVTIVARAEEEGAEKKLLRAGANRVISPYVIGGHRVAQAVLRPTVIDFLELATREDYLDLQIEEVAVVAGSPLVGAQIKDTGIRRDLGIIVVAVQRGSAPMMFNPAPEMALAAGDTLITLGHRDQLERLQELARS